MEKVYLNPGQIAVLPTKTGGELEVSVEIITPEVAEIYRQRVRVNRKIKQRVVDAYAKDMLDGNWKVNGEPIIFLKGGIQGNGEHRELGCIKANVPFETLVVRGVEEDAIKTMDAGAKRSTGDNLQIEFGEDVYDPNTTGSAVKNTLDLREGGLIITAKARNITESEISEEFKKNQTFYDKVVRYAAKVYSAWKGLSKSELATTIAHLILNLHHPEERVFDFFDQLTDQKGACTTVRTLRIKLNGLRGEKEAASKDGYRIDAGKSVPVLRRIMLTKAWNAFVAGNFDLDQISYVYTRDATCKFI